MLVSCLPSHYAVAPSSRFSFRVSSRLFTLAPVVYAAATGRFALLQRVVTATASNASGRHLVGASFSVTRVTSLSSRRDRGASSSKAHHSSQRKPFARSKAHANRSGGLTAAATHAALRAFAAAAAGDEGSESAKTKVPMFASDATTRVVVWFRNDLRLADNYVVQRAEQLASGDDKTEILPVYCFDPRFFERSAWGTPKTGGHRARFQHECVSNLKKNLRAIGSDLLVVVGKPEDVIAQHALGDGKTTIVLTQVRREPVNPFFLFRSRAFASRQ